jgi:DNA-binding CsgD family transcriptional regulator
MQTLELLLPQPRRAVPGPQPLGTARDLATLDLIRTSHGCLLLASDGRVLHANAAARQITAANEELRLANDGLHARSPSEDALLQELLRLARFGRGGQARSGGRLTLQRPRGLPVTVQTLPLASHWLAQAFPGCTLVLIIDGERMARIGRQALQELYGLTPAEAALAVRIPGSRGLQKLAEELGLSLSTVRTHLQRAFEKTGTHRQAELVQLISELDRIGADPADHA